MPCAAASSSMPRMCAVLCDHRLQPARREGRHRDVVFLVGAGRQAVDAGRVGERLVLARQRRRGDVGDHEAAVQARRRRSRNGGRRETSASISIAMRRSAIAPTSAIASAIASAARATGSAWKLPPETSSPRPVPSLAGEDERVVGDGVRLAQQHQRGVAQLVEAGADDLRLAAQAVRVLHAIVALEMTSARIALPASRRGSTAATSICPGWPRSAWMRGSNGPSLPRAASTVSAPIDERRFEHRLEREQRVQRQRGRDLRAVDQRQAFLRARARAARCRRRAAPSAAGDGAAPSIERTRLRRAAPASCAPAARGRPRRRPMPWLGT